ncbi:MAG: FtsX-like permease family protein [Pseudomonadota bacterium]|nr:FtsX-like permease family protein [Pseudomonadota bacterium]
MSLAKIGQLAWRNLWRQRRRNLTMLVALSFAVMGVIFLNAFLRGMTAQMADGAINSMVGHVKVLQPGYRDDPGIARSFVLESEWSPEIPAGQLQGWARRVRVPAVIMSERETRGIEFIGIDPAQESISFVADWTVEGEQLEGPGDRRILVGRSLAEQLETAAGRRLVIVTQGADGRSREAGYRIAGLYQSEHSALEKFHVFTGIEAAQALLVSDTVTEVSVRLTDEKYQPTVLQSLIATFVGLNVFDWQTLQPMAATMMQLSDAMIYILFIIVMSALVFGLVNTVVTAVMERYREIGMLRALGMRAGAVLLQIVTESTLIMIMGVVIGTAAGGGLCLWLSDGVDLSAFSEGLEAFGFSSNTLVPTIMPADLAFVMVASLVMGVVASFFPALRAVRLNPLEAMRR